MSETIKSITEAFSMQPNCFEVCNTPESEIRNGIKMVHNHNGCIKEIVPETRQVASDKQCNYYVGYNFNGEKMFEYLQSSVNVHYITWKP